jgi:hypothetical protein
MEKEARSSELYNDKILSGGHGCYIMYVLTLGIIQSRLIQCIWEVVVSDIKDGYFGLS